MDKYWKELTEKDKEIIQLKDQLKKHIENNEDVEKIKSDKKQLQ